MQVKRGVMWVGRAAMTLVTTWLALCVLLAALVHHAGTVDRAARSDVIIVLGAALSRDGTPYKALTRRATHAAELWKQGQAPAVICTGGVGAHVRVPRSEADGCREVLMREGVPQAAIVLEDMSANTEENARNSLAIMATHGWRTAIVVSDSYHVFRAGRIARSIGLDVVLSPVPVAQVDSPLFYVLSVVREVGALQWRLLT